MTIPISIENPWIILVHIKNDPRSPVFALRVDMSASQMVTLALSRWSLCRHAVVGSDLWVSMRVSITHYLELCGWLKTLYSHHLVN